MPKTYSWGRRGPDAPTYRRVCGALVRRWAESRPFRTRWTGYVERGGLLGGVEPNRGKADVVSSVPGQGHPQKGIFCSSIQCWLTGLITVQSSAGVHNAHRFWMPLLTMCHGLVFRGGTGGDWSEKIKYIAAIAAHGDCNLHNKSADEGLYFSIRTRFSIQDPQVQTRQQTNQPTSCTPNLAGKKSPASF